MKNILGCEYRVVNIFGTVIQSGLIENSEYYQIDISQLPSSMYILQINRSDGYCKTINVIKI